MAMRFMDGFEHYTTILHKYENVVTNAPTFTTGRFGQGLSLQANTVGRGVAKTLDSQPTWVVGFAYKTDGIGIEHVIARLFDSATQHVDLRVNTSGFLYGTRAGTGIGSVGTTPIVANVWYYIEWYVTIHDTTGVMKCNLSGIQQFNNTGLDTRNGANSTANIVQLTNIVGTGSVPTILIDDLYICDGTGGTNNDFLGDLRIENLMPNGNGNSSVLVGSDGNSADNYLLVDETPPNDGTDYVESSTPGDKDTYAYANLASTSGTVFGVQVLPRAVKTDAGARSIVSVARLSATEVDGPVQTLQSSYTYLPDIRETKPGGGAWTVTDVNSAEFGVKINA